MDTAARAKRLEMEGGWTLPEEIVEDILSRLPVRSLRRFRCVSRAWDALITSPAFEDLHSDRSRHHRRLFLKPTCQNVFYAWKLGGPAETIMDNWRLPQGKIFPITKSCHGIVLLRCLDYDLHYVWNPSANQLLALPDRRPARVAWAGGRTHMIYGMGYCSTAKQYKIVRMYNFDRDLGLHDTVCEVYTLDESTHWRPAATQPHSCQLRVNGRQGAVLCNGNLHFVHTHGLDLLTVFNIHAETFSTMVLPAETRSYSPDFMLTELGGFLCVYHAKRRDHPEFADPYDIWLQRDYEAGQWERLQCINWGSMGEAEIAPLKSSWIAPLDMYYDHGAQKKKILFGTSACKVFVVDPDTGVPEVVFSPEDTIMGDQGNWDSEFPTIGLFEERLASVGRTNEEIIFTSPWARAASSVLMYLPARTVGRLNQVQSPGGFHQRDTPDVPPLVDEGSRVVYSKPCNGLNAGSWAKYDFVCNPLTKYYRAINLGNGKNAASCSSDIQRTPSVALGYAPNIGMHVLVSLAYKEKNRTSRDYKLECKIQLIERRHWVKIDPPSRPMADAPPVYASGKLYWIVDPEFGPTSACSEIIMLYLNTLEFHVLAGPPCGKYYISITELQGEVCVTCSRPSTNTIEIWDMDGNGMWSMRRCIELASFFPEYSSKNTTLLAVNPNDGRILLSTGRSLGYYASKTVELETIYHLDSSIQGKKFVPVLAMDSLVQPCDAVV
ncbi:hypothetical protein CFC21_028736 [Triticum aestivum]|uniref:F-box domain-containing protein n=2 Tax=Triticum aestivum TaxID=4565 RepID=A0A9R1DMT1_WHEAT|nr:hypothetical protein CFC21_011322 [Triticum aestivum]KAF7014788.1 hypothetical protein CFC21_028736 [Triticum aestivum]